MCLWDHAEFFFLGVSPGLLAARPCGCFLSFLSLAFSPPENTGFWILDFYESSILDFESWILDLGFGILIPSTTKGLESLVLCSCDATEHWQNREILDLGF